jgi:hypothetical protein
MGHEACPAQRRPFLPQRASLAGAASDRGGPANRRLLAVRDQTNLIGSESVSQQCHFALLGAWALTGLSWHRRRDLGSGGRRRSSAVAGSTGRWGMRSGPEEMKILGGKMKGSSLAQPTAMGSRGSSDGALAAAELEKGRGVNYFIAEKGLRGLEAGLRKRCHAGMGRARHASSAGQWLPTGWTEAGFKRI